MIMENINQEFQKNKLFLSPEEFSKRSGLKTCHVRHLCKTNKIENIRTANGGYYKIPVKELYKFKGEGEFTKEMYENLLRENEQLKTKIANARLILSIEY